MHKLVIKRILFLLLSLAGPITLLNLINMSDLLLPSLILVISSYLFYSFIKNRILKLFISILIISFFLISLIIIPFTFYLTWFQIVQIQIPEGVVTTDIMLFLSYIFGFFMGSISYKVELQKIVNLLLILLLFTSFIIRLKVIFIAILLLLTISIIINIIKVKRYEKIIYTLTMGIIIFLLSLLIYNLTVENGSKTVNNSSYNLRKIINDNFPEYNLLSTIPGLTTPYKSTTGKPPILTSNSLLKINGTPGKSYYLRMKVGHNSEEFVISRSNNIDKKSSINSFKITVLTDFLPIFPSVLNYNGSNIIELPGDSSLTLKLTLPLIKQDSFRLYSGSINEKLDEDKLTKPSVSDEIKELALKFTGVKVR